MWGAILLTMALQMAIIYVPFLHPIFKTTYLDIKAMAAIFIVTIAAVLFIELWKLIIKKTATTL
jgi:Ca2+-transporting ATPase